MAGGFGFKTPKDKNLVKKNNSEILKEFPDSSPSKPKTKLSGILFPGQTINFKSGESHTDINWSHEFSIKPVNQEQRVFQNNQTQEVQQTINELRAEIKKLTLSTANLDQEVVQAVAQNIPESNEYQLSFLQRIKNLIIEFRKNIDQSCIWMESFNRKKSRKNAFWGKVKDEGEQYLFSSEHSVARSAN